MGVSVEVGVVLGVWTDVFLNSDGCINRISWIDTFCFIGAFVSDLGGQGGEKLFLIRMSGKTAQRMRGPTLPAAFFFIFFSPLSVQPSF